MIARSASGVTTVSCEAELLVGSGSALGLATTAVLWIVPATVGLTTIVIGTVAPDGTVPSEQTTVLVPEQLP